MGQANSNAELHIQLHLVEEIPAELKVVIDDGHFGLVNNMNTYGYNLLSLKPTYKSDRL